MDRLAAIIEYQWRAQWRQFSRAGKLAAGNRGITVVVTVLLLVKYLRWLSSARIEVAQGNPGLLSLLLAGVFAACVSVFLANTRTTRSLSDLRRLPLSTSDLFVIRIVSTIMTPFFWLVLAGALAIIYPIAKAPEPIAGSVAAMLFIAGAWFTGLLLSNLMTSKVWRRVFFASLVLSGAGAVYIVNNNQSTLIAKFSRLAPNALAAEAAMGNRSWSAIAILFGCAALTLVAARLSVGRSLIITPSQSTNRKTPSFLFGLSGRWSAFTAKDFRYSLRLLDPYFGVLVSALGCLYLISSSAPTVTAVLAIILIIFVPNAPLAFNSFGLDTVSGMDRYALLPASGRSIIRSKNLAFALFTGAQVLPLILLSTWRLGLLALLVGLVQAASLAIAYVTWGNLLSVAMPSKMQFYRFAPATYGIMEIMAGVVLNSLPGAVILLLIRAYGEWALWAAVPILLACVLLYYLATNRSGRRFEMRCEKVRDSLV